MTLTLTLTVPLMVMGGEPLPAETCSESVQRHGLLRHLARGGRIQVIDGGRGDVARERVQAAAAQM